MKLYNIKGTQVPIIYTSTIKKESCIFGTLGIINIILNKNDGKQLEYVLENYSDNILKTYNSMNKKVILRTMEEYDDICAKYFIKYEKQLNVEAMDIIHAPFDLMYLGWAYRDHSIILNSNMRYMQEEVIKLTIYHELCHLYTLDNYGTFEHNDDFYNILYKEFPKKEVERIKSA